MGGGQGKRAVSVCVCGGWVDSVFGAGVLRWRAIDTSPQTGVVGQSHAVNAKMAVMG